MIGYAWPDKGSDANFAQKRQIYLLTNQPSDQLYGVKSHSYATKNKFVWIGPQEIDYRVSTRTMPH